MKVGELLKCLKKRRNRKEGRGNKDCKKEGKLGQGVVGLKRKGAGTPLRTMDHFFTENIIMLSVKNFNFLHKKGRFM